MIEDYGPWYKNFLWFQNTKKCIIIRGFRKEFEELMASFNPINIYDDLPWVYDPFFKNFFRYGHELPEEDDVLYIYDDEPIPLSEVY